MRFEDLSPAERSAVRKGQVTVPRASVPAGRAALSELARGAARHRCDTCGATFARYAPAERHVDATHGHGRIACVL